MSLRYTGEATMDEPALRDVERWKDKIEVRLDNRQVFFLFFGSAMVACMLFVLGVIVGKRLESRGRAEAPPVEDPLAVLDRFGALTTATPAPAALTFPKALIGNGHGNGQSTSASKSKAGTGAEKAERPSSATDATNERIAAERVTAKTTLTAAVPLPPAASAAPVAPAKAATAVAVEPTVRPAPAAQKAVSALKPGQPARLSAAPAAPAGGSSTGTSNRLAALPRPVTAANKTSSSVASKEPSQSAKVTTNTVDKSKGRFLLQLSSFQDRSEADAFARRFSAQNAYVVATEIPGKGTWYRVRVGSYGTLQDASAAKTSFERDHNVIAYVAGSGPAK